MILTRRQREILSFIEQSLREKGYAPSLHEIGGRFRLRSIATVHKHLVHLEEKGLIKRHWNRPRAIEVVAPEPKPQARSVPVQGLLIAGKPVGAVRQGQSVAVPEEWIEERDVCVLQVSGQFPAEERIDDGDCVVMEKRTDPREGEVVVALLDGAETFVRRFYREKDRIRLQPASSTGNPIVVLEDRVVIRGIVVGLVRRY